MTNDYMNDTEKLAHQRRIAGSNMDYAVIYRNMLQKLLDRHNGEADTMTLTILSPVDVTEIEEALAWRD